MEYSINYILINCYFNNNFDEYNLYHLLTNRNHTLFLQSLYMTDSPLKGLNTLCPDLIMYIQKNYQIKLRPYMLLDKSKMTYPDYRI